MKVADEWREDCNYWNVQIMKYFELMNKSKFTVVKDKQCFIKYIFISTVRIFKNVISINIYRSVGILFLFKHTKSKSI